MTFNELSTTTQCKTQTKSSATDSFHTRLSYQFVFSSDLYHLMGRKQSLICIYVTIHQLGVKCFYILLGVEEVGLFHV